MITKDRLAIILSKLKIFETPNLKLEQYPTDSQVAAEILWFAHMHKDIQGKVVADLGSGTGILGIGALILGAKQVYFVDVDNQALTLAKQNLQSLNLQNAVFLKQEIQDFNQKVDTVLQNPPFGVQNPHADRPFLDKAFQISKTIYSLHMEDSEQFIKQRIPANFTLKHIIRFKLPIKKTQKFHKKPIHDINTACFVIKRNV